MLNQRRRDQRTLNRTARDLGDTFARDWNAAQLEALCDHPCSSPTAAAWLASAAATHHELHASAHHDHVELTSDTGNIILNHAGRLPHWVRRRTRLIVEGADTWPSTIGLHLRAIGPLGRNRRFRINADSITVNWARQPANA